MGRGEAAEKLSPEEDPRTSTKGGLPCAGISPRTTMRPTLREPGLMGLRTGPTLRRHPPTAPPPEEEGEGLGGWRRRTLEGGWSTAIPPQNVAATDLAGGIYNPAPASGGGGGGGGGGPRRQEG